MYSCPLCGKDSNRRGDPFNDPDRVIAHITGSHDADHDGVDGEEYREEIKATADGADSGGEPAPATDGGTVTAQSPAQADQRPRETVDMTPEEFDQAIAQATEEAHQEGYEAGIQAAEGPSDEEMNELWHEAYNEGYEAGKADAANSDDALSPETPPCGHGQMDPVSDILREIDPVIECETCGKQYIWSFDG